MNYKIDKTNDSVKIEMTFSEEEWQSAIDAAFKANAGKYVVEGFRKGKAPRKMIEKTHGEDVFMRPALESLFFSNYKNVLEENKDIKPVEYPNLDVKIVEAGGIILTATIDVEPTFTLGAYTGLQIEKTVITISDKHIDEYLKKMQEGRARQIAAGKGYQLADGDIAVIDFTGSIDGVEFEGGAAKKHELEIGSHSFIDNFEEQLVGLTAGTTTDVSVTFPKDYHAKNLAGAKAVFKVEIKNILRKELPAIDDTFARESSEFDTLALLREDIAQKLTKQAVIQSKMADENNLLKEVVENTKIIVPDKITERQLDGIMQDMEYRLALQGLTLEMYAQSMGITIDEFRAKQREQAEVSVRSRLVFEAIMEKEGIKATKEEIEAEAKRAAEANGKKLSEYTKSKEQMAYIEHDLLFAKMLDLLTQKNKFI